MKNHSLEKNGLSLSQAQSISNLCHQRSLMIDSKITNRNNAEKSLIIDEKIYIETLGKPIPSDIVKLLLEKSKLHATQAFLMENIKAKDEIIENIRAKDFDTIVEHIKAPIYKEYEMLNSVNESWGWEQLLAKDYNEYLEAEAFAAHIGQFIHRDGTLDVLRRQILRNKTLEFMEIEVGKKTPLKIELHHTTEGLLDLHEKLAVLHRGYEQKVNYFKAKIKNLITEENAKIAKTNAYGLGEINEINAKLRNVYITEVELWNGNYKKALQEFEEIRQKEISKAAALRINVDPRFQDIIDTFLKNIE